MICKKVFLTYSQSNFLTFDILKERLLNNNVAIYVFSQENHKEIDSENEEFDENSEIDEFEDEYLSESDENGEFSENEIFDSDEENEGDTLEENEGEGIHFHCYLEYTEKIDIRNPTYFDITTETDEGYEIAYHPNIQYVRMKRACIQYIKKDSNWISNEDDRYNLVQSFTTKSELLKWIYDNNETHKAKFWLDVWNERTIANVEEDRIDLPYFKWWVNIPKVNFKTGFNTESSRPKALYLLGAPETGKTLWISQFMGNEKKFYVGDWKQFNLYKNERIIVFEDFMIENFKNMTGFFKSLITDTYINLFTPSFYGSHLINKERIIIFSSNVEPTTEKFFDEALISRLVIVRSDNRKVNSNVINSSWNRIYEIYSRKLAIQGFHSYCKGILNTITEDK